MSNREEARYVISVAAEMSGMHPQTLRIYERRGLIEPYRTPGGTRRYSEADIERLSLIQSAIETRSIACAGCSKNPTLGSTANPSAGPSSGWVSFRRGIFPRFDRNAHWADSCRAVAE
jgi:hypothetical protein